MELKAIKDKILFVDFTTNKAKIALPNGKTKTIRFRTFKNEFDKLVFEILQKDEKYCV